jgi:hypothetical protein
MTATDTHQPGHRAGFFVALVSRCSKNCRKPGPEPGQPEAARQAPTPATVPRCPSDRRAWATRRALGCHPSRFQLPRFWLSAVLLVGCRLLACILSRFYASTVALAAPYKMSEIRRLKSVWYQGITLIRG